MIAVVKTPADIVGSALGELKKNTKAILAASMGKVIVINEAYGLGGAGSGITDLYRAAVINTLIVEAQGILVEDRCIFLLGYRDSKVSIFQAVNHGLSRRFPLDLARVLKNALQWNRTLI